MDIVWLYLLGALGAILTLYIRSDEPIPSFRAFFDYEAQEVELEKVKNEITADEEIRKSYSKDYRNGVLDNSKFEYLTREIDDLIADMSMKRLSLEKRVAGAQILHRSLGFIFYVVFGSLFAGLLSNIIDVEGLEGPLSSALKPLVLGATWTTYLSLLGFRDQKNKVTALTNQVTSKVEEMDQTLASLQNLITDPNKSNTPEIGNLLNKATALSADAQKKLSKFK